MATLTINVDAIGDNVAQLDAFFASHGNRAWTLVTKVLCGHYETLSALKEEGILSIPHSVGDSRLDSLSIIKSLDPDIPTMYIKPPEVGYADQVVRYSDYSLNSSYYTLKALNNAASRLGITHRVILMVELGEIREGVQGESLLGLVKQARGLQNIEIAGIGTNLGCMYGIEPTRDKMVQLDLYRQIIESECGVALEYLSGGSSITLPLVESGRLPASINHFRVGEAAFFGTTPIEAAAFNGLNTDTFLFEAQIIEFYKKYNEPDGLISEANIGHTAEPESGIEKSYRAIMDFGLLDTDHESLKPRLDADFVGISSDMVVYACGDGEKDHAVGEIIPFDTNYMAVAKLMHSAFIHKNVKKKGL
jgi:predicted amino acid racemase